MQKTAYELRISDWSSDVCSSDLDRLAVLRVDALRPEIGLAQPALDRVTQDRLRAAAHEREGEGPRVGLPHDGVETLDQVRSEERRVGKACVSTCRSRWAQ